MSLAPTPGGRDRMSRFSGFLGYGELVGYLIERHRRYPATSMQFMSFAYPRVSG
jgi:hypothetical protein